MLRMYTINDSHGNICKCFILRLGEVVIDELNLKWAFKKDILLLEIMLPATMNRSRVIPMVRWLEKKHKWHESF